MSFRNGFLQVFNSKGEKLIGFGDCNLASYKLPGRDSGSLSVIKESKPGVYSVWPFAYLQSYVFRGIETPTEGYLDPVGELMKVENNPYKKRGILFVNDELIHEGDFWFFKVDYTPKGEKRGHQDHISYIVDEDSPEVHCVKFSSDLLSSVVSFVETIDNVPEADLIFFKPL